MSDLNELDNVVGSDIDVAPPDQYADSSAATLPLKGTYDLVIKAVEPSTNRETKEPDGKAFVVTYEVQLPESRTYQLRFVRVWTKPFDRNGIKVSQLGDLIRAIDDTATWHGLSGAAEVLQKAMDQQTPIRARLDWEAFDRDHFEEEGGNAMPRSSEEAKTLRKASTIKGMKNFPKYPDGTFKPEVVGPSGNILPARVVVTNYIAASKRK